MKMCYVVAQYSSSIDARILGAWSQRLLYSGTNIFNTIIVYVQKYASFHKLYLMYVSLNGLKDSERDVTVLKMSEVMVSCELLKIWNSCRRF
jgi:hypothetical protein